jgi:spore maturation protein CgeB
VPRQRRVLLLCPTFHGYGVSIGEALGRLGYLVHTHRYDDFSGARRKLHNKLVYELPDRRGGDGGAARFRAAATRTAVALLEEVRPDIVVAIKADVIGPEFWQRVRDARLPHLLWLYDELRRMRHGPDSLRDFPAVASYSRLDVAALEAAGLSAHYLPNGFDHTIAFTPVPSDEVVFVGARYPDRVRLLEHLASSGVATRAYGRQWSHHPVDRLRTWDLRRPDLPHGRDLDRGEAYGRLAGAVAALNSHTDQDGFTMRTFEAPGVGGLQLIDRPDVDEFFEPGKEVLVFRSDDELVDLCRRAAADRAWGRRIAERGRARTLAEHTFDHRAVAMEQMWA